SSGRFAPFDDLLTLTVRASDGDERHGPFLPKRDYEDEAQCDSNLSPSPLLKHYPFFHQIPIEPVATGPRFIDEHQMCGFRLHLTDEVIDVTLACPNGAQGGDLGAMLLGDIRDGNRLFVDIHSDKECARLGHG